MSRPRSPARLYLRRSRKDRPPTWVVRDGKKEVGTGAGRNDRQRAEEAFLQEYLAHNYRPPEGANRPDQILITEALTAYMLAVEGKPSAAHIRSMSKSLIAWWADKTIADILGDSCRAYVDWRITQPIRSYTRNKPRLATPETARQELATLRTAVRYYHREYRLSEALPLFTLPEKAPPKDSYWTREDAARRLWAARKSPHTRHLCRLILLGIYSDTRPGALIRMRWLPSLTSGHIDVENGLLYRAPRGRKQSNKRQPPVRLHWRLIPHVRRWRAADEAHGVSHVVSYQGRGITSVRHAWEVVRLEAGAEQRDTPHIMRHSAATWLMQNGVDLWEAAGYLGMSPEILNSVYGHHSPSFQQNAARSTAQKRPSNA